MKIFAALLMGAMILANCAGAEAALAASDFAQKLPEELCGLAAKAIPGRSTLPYKQSALRALAQDICVLLGRRAEEAGCR